MTEPTLECGMRPIHPGEILRDELAGLGLSGRGFARALGIPRHQRRHRAPARPVLRHGPGVWMDLQSEYESAPRPPRGGRHDPAQCDAAGRCLNGTFDDGSSRPLAARPVAERVPGVKA